MRALTIKQPYAAWIADGHKTIEIRSWATDYRGPLLITASANPANCRADLDDGRTITLPAGCTVCVVDLIACRPATAADEADAGCHIIPGDIAWIFANPRPVEPLPVRGKLKVWDHPGPVNYLPAGMDWLDYTITG